MYKIAFGATIFSLILLLAPNVGFSQSVITGFWRGDAGGAYDLVKTGIAAGEGVKFIIRVCLAPTAAASNIRVEGWDADAARKVTIGIIKGSCGVTFGSNIIIKINQDGEGFGTFAISR